MHFTLFIALRNMVKSLAVLVHPLCPGCPGCVCYLPINYLITFLVITLAIVYHSTCIQRTLLTYLIMATPQRKDIKYCR